MVYIMIDAADWTPCVCKGWQPIVLQALTKLNALNNPDLYIVQVKEKFGGLRIYTSPTDEEIMGIIRDAEIAASVTCEFCGSTDSVKKLPVRHWYKTVCANCYKEKSNE